MTAKAGMHEALAPPLREWVADQAAAMGLPGPDDYILVLIRLEQQRQGLDGVDQRYQEVFRNRRWAPPSAG